MPQYFNFYLINWFFVSKTIQGRKLLIIRTFWPQKLFKGGNYVRKYGMYLLICIPFAINWRFISHIPHGRPSSFHYFITSLCWKKQKQMKLLYKSKILIRQCVDHVISTGPWMLKLVWKLDLKEIQFTNKGDLNSNERKGCTWKTTKKHANFKIQRSVEMTWCKHKVCR